MEHKWFKGKDERMGNLIYRDDQCRCGCIRRTVLNDNNKEEIESYTIGEEITIEEPECSFKKRTKYRIFKTKEKPDITQKAAYNKLIGYIKSQIYFNTWIYDKNFYNPEDVLIDAYMIVGDKECDLDEFIRAINTVIYKEWNKYRKTDLKGYRNYLFKRKMEERENSAELSDSYVLLVEQKRVLSKTGKHVTFKELRSTPGLIENVRARILFKRGQLLIYSGHL